MTKLSSKYKTGETAKALVMEWFRDFGSDAKGKVNEDAYTYTAERLIKHLTDNNFVIAPRPYSRPARRGTGNTKPKPYTGPELIGKSHSARLAGQ